MRILFVVPYMPNLIRVRPYNLIRALIRRGHQVTVLTLTSNPDEVRQAQELAQECLVFTRPLPRWRSLVNSLRALPGDAPLQAHYCWQPALAQDLKRLVQQAQYDVVHVEHLRGARYATYLKQQIPAAQRPPIVWDSVDCISFLFRQAATQSQSTFGRLITRLELQRTERYEGSLLGQFEHVLVTSPADREALSALPSGPTPPAPIHVIPNGVDLHYFQPDSSQLRQPDTLVLSGKMSYHANITMALYLVREVMPRVWSQLPNVRLTIVGKDPPREILSLATNDSINVTGTVADIRPYLQQASIAVAPIRYGAGIQNKILEAMACGTPVITTPAATAALSATAGRDLIIAADAPAFATAILELLSNKARRQAVAAAGLSYIRSCHDWDAISGQLERVYSSTPTTLA